MRRPYRLLVLAAVLVLAACGGGDAPTDGPAPIKVGAIFDFTGPTSDVGTIYAEGIRGYFEHLQAQGGLDGRPVELIYQDYGYKVDVAEQLYSQFVQEGAVIFFGWGTGDTEALRGRVADDQVPFTSASYSHVLGNPDEAPYNFLVGASYTDQIAILIDHVLENHANTGEKGDAEAPVIALMHHPSPFGLSPYEQGGRDYAEARGITITAHEMPRGATDLTAELTRIRESGAQYVFFQNTSSPVVVALQNARDMGYDARFYCLNWCSNEITAELAGDAAEGLIGSIVFSPPSDDVAGLADAAAFLESQGSSLAEKGLVYGQGWTTAAVMFEGVRRVAAQGQEITGANVKAALETLQDFDTGGVTVPVSFSPTSHRGTRGMRLFQVQGGKWEQLTDFRTAGSVGG